MFILAIWICRS